MTKSEFLVYLDTEISASQARISTKNTKSDRVDTGRVEFLTVIKNMLTKNATPEDVGRLGRSTMLRRNWVCWRVRKPCFPGLKGELEGHGGGGALAPTCAACSARLHAFQRAIAPYTGCPRPA